MGCGASNAVESTDEEVATADSGCTLYLPYAQFSEEIQSVMDGAADTYLTGLWTMRKTVAFMKDPNDPSTYKEVPHIVTFPSKDAQKHEAKASRAGASALAVLEVLASKDDDLHGTVVVECRLRDIVPIGAE